MKALIASSDSEIMMSLCDALADLNVDLDLCSSVTEVKEELVRSHVDIVFCEPRLSDGTFRNLLEASDSCGLKPAVIVCSDSYDKKVYLDAMNLGAFDYVALPFQKTTMDWIVGNAAQRQTSPSPRTHAHAGYR